MMDEPCPKCQHVDDVADLCDECADDLCNELVAEYGLPHETFTYVVPLELD